MECQAPEYKCFETDNMNQIDAFRRLRSLAMGIALLGVAIATSLSVTAGAADSAKHQERQRIEDESKNVEE